MTDQNNRNQSIVDIDWGNWLINLWAQKIIIVSSIAISIILGWMYSTTVEKTYTSNIQYQQYLKVPYANFVRLRQDFYSTFNAPETYAEWSASKEGVKTKSTDLVAVQNINGNLTTTAPALISLSDNLKDIKWGKGSISIKSGDAAVLQDTFEYSNFVNQKVTRQYYDRLKRIYKTIPVGQTLKEGRKILLDHSSGNTTLDFVYFFEEVQGGFNIFRIAPPSNPTLISKSRKTILIFSAMLGMILGMFLTHIRPQTLDD